MKTVRVHLALITVSVLFGIAYVVGKYVLQFLTPSAWAFTRAAVAATILLVLYGKRFFALSLSAKQWLMLLVCGLFGVAINQISFFEGLARTTPTHSAVINALSPMLTLLFGILLREEKPNLPRVAGLTLSLVGVLVVLNIENQSSGNELFIGDLFILMNALSFSFYLAFSRRLNQQIDPAVVTVGMFLVGSCFVGFYGAPAAIHYQWHQLPHLAYLAMAFLILGGTIGTYSLNNWALSRVDSSAVALYIYIQPIVAGGLSHYIYGEVLTVRFVFGSLLVLSGIAVGNQVFGKQKRVR